ncbi:peptidylprolyl isomerase [Aliiroseovarius halocynthiae]|uniref:Peptidyl-prolyl cis-trans isomerase n=1 Tax=Aliiroseovarius halocynthiae TaxID=985055 RepID=A0A545SYF7_9RHOB|nr:peptidylprolyl isomerase [Aliiroseovarius halocynthiae]TQV69991.1 peptidylprolyl isomerase [Aliiroseovarius halocynthiae]SMR70657.1 peptidylprolyl isomerase [Aliiroseovarius halocynthiae]
MTEVTQGAKVRIHYTGTLEDGSVFDSSEGRDPLEFEVGSGMIIPGLDKALPGMTVGEKKNVTIAPEEAYGPSHAEAILEVPRSDIPAEIPLEVGIQLQMSGPQGQPVPVTVTNLTDDTVTLDANHALAGKTLIFDFEVVGIG